MPGERPTSNELVHELEAMVEAHSKAWRTYRTAQPQRAAPEPPPNPAPVMQQQQQQLQHQLQQLQLQQQQLQQQQYQQQQQQQQQMSPGAARMGMGMQGAHYPDPQGGLQQRPSLQQQQPAYPPIHGQQQMYAKGGMGQGPNQLII